MDMNLYATCEGSSCTSGSLTNQVPDSEQQMFVSSVCANADDLKIFAEAVSVSAGILTCQALADTSTPGAQISVDMSWTVELDCGSVTSGPVYHAREELETDASSTFAPTMAVIV